MLSVGGKRTSPMVCFGDASVRLTCCLNVAHVTTTTLNVETVEREQTLSGAGGDWILRVRYCRRRCVHTALASRRAGLDAVHVFLFWEFGGARGSTVVANLCANALRLRSDMLLTRVLVCRARSYNSI